MPLLDALAGGHPVAQALIVLSLVAVGGLAIGSIKFGNVRLGVGGALFSGLAFAHFGIAIDAGILAFVREFGLILFVYCIGLQVGPGFFNALRKDGLRLNAIAVAVVALGVTGAAVLHLAGLPLPVVLGLLAGAVTNTPSLAAAQQMLHEVGVEGAGLVLPGLGYAVAYPFGILGTLLSIIVVRALFRIDTAAEAQAFEEARRKGREALETANIEILNPNLDGLKLREIPALATLGVVLSRVLHDGSQHVARPEDRVALGDVVLAVGPKDKLRELRLIMGAESDLDLKAMPSGVKWERLVVTSAKVLGATLGEMNLRRVHGVTLSRVVRAGVELVPSSALRLEFGDIVTAIGEPAGLAEVARMLGNKASALQHAQIAPIFIGIALGIMLGGIPISLPGLSVPLKLGLAGGPLVAALALSRIGHVGRLVWFMPPASNTVLREIGIVLFLAAVGLRAGGSFVATVVDGDGLLWMACGALLTVIPLLVAGIAARWFARTNFLTVGGLLAGSMTDPPALAFANALHPSEAPSLAYATVYPLVMVLRVLSPQILVLALG